MLPMKPVRFNVDRFFTVTFDLGAVLPILTVSVALSTTTLL
jgi:hypothetical protein